MASKTQASVALSLKSQKFPSQIFKPFAEVDRLFSFESERMPISVGGSFIPNSIAE